MSSSLRIVVGRNISVFVVSFLSIQTIDVDFLESMFSRMKLVDSNSRVFWGWLFLIVGSVSFTGFIYAAVISKIQPPSHNVFIHAIQNDWYYCFLIPLTAPILFVAVYFHWLSMKLFKHA